ncbi:citryl-CoA lyase [Marinobacter sp.]|uniref:citryl-CoA lyase n=1 Tax=Marinobacter sp. TaxID=50741 RepID=UPI0034A5305E
MNDSVQNFEAQNQAADWWRTEIIDMEPNKINFRGYPIEQLIGQISFVDMIWFMLTGAMPSKGEARLIEAALVAGVDHGPQAPSIAIARMAMTCGGSLNNALASAVNVLDDVHGGAGEQAMMLFQDIRWKVEQGLPMSEATREGLDKWRCEKGKIVPGFGHRFHTTDPRAPRLIGLVREAAGKGVVSGNIADIGAEIEKQLGESKSRNIPLNIDGATAVIFSELGLPAPLGRGLFCLSRSVGILAHAWEQQLQGGRNKGPLPKGWLWKYDGVPPRDFKSA